MLSLFSCCFPCCRPRTPAPPPPQQLGLGPAGTGANRAEQIASYAQRVAVEGEQFTQGQAPTASDGFTRLTASMCWDAVALCSMHHGGQDPRPITGDSSAQLVSTQDALITSGNQFTSNVPAGATIGFFDRNTHALAHAMVALGNGWAAGSNNGCIGGQNYWSRINIGANWTGTGGYNVSDNRGGVRTLEVRYRAAA